MFVELEVPPKDQPASKPLFADMESYIRFRDWYVKRVSKKMEKLQEARRKSEQDSRQRLLR